MRDAKIRVDTVAEAEGGPRNQNKPRVVCRISSRLLRQTQKHGTVRKESKELLASVNLNHCPAASADTGDKTQANAGR